MKIRVLVLISLLFSLSAFGQEYSTFYHQRASLFEELPIKKGDIVFVGNSLTNGGEWFELFNNLKVKNRGISGDVCQGVYDRLDPILKGRPKKIFLMIGVNDLARGKSVDNIIEGIYAIVDKIKRDSPRTKIYVQSLLPFNNTFSTFSGHTSKGSEVLAINGLLASLAKEWEVTFIDLYGHFIDEADGKMDKKYTNDGLHLLGAGYTLWAQLLKPYVK